MRAGLIALICVAGCGRVGYAVLPQSVADATVDPGADGGHVGEMDSGRDAEADAGDVDGDAGDVDGGGDAGDVDGGGDASIDLPCGTTVFFADDFEDGTAAPQWVPFAHRGMTTVEETGRLHVRFAPMTGTPPAYGGYQTMSLGDLPGACVTLDAPDVPELATDGIAFVKILAGTREVEILETRGRLLVRTADTGVTTVVANIGYDALAHRHWRIRDAGGSIRCEVSADGVTFVELATITEPISLAGLRIAFGAGAYVPTTDAGDAQFESLVLTSR